MPVEVIMRSDTEALDPRCAPVAGHFPRKSRRLSRNPLHSLPTPRKREERSETIVGARVCQGEKVEPYRNPIFEYLTLPAFQRNISPLPTRINATVTNKPERASHERKNRNSWRNRTGRLRACNALGCSR